MGTGENGGAMEGFGRGGGARERRRGGGGAAATNVVRRVATGGRRRGQYGQRVIVMYGKDVPGAVVRSTSDVEREHLAGT